PVSGDEDVLVVIRDDDLTEFVRPVLRVRVPGVQTPVRRFRGSELRVHEAELVGLDLTVRALPLTQGADLVHEVEDRIVGDLREPFHRFRVYGGTHSLDLVAGVLDGKTELVVEQFHQLLRTVHVEPRLSESVLQGLLLREGCSLHSDGPAVCLLLVFPDSALRHPTEYGLQRHDGLVVQVFEPEVLQFPFLLEVAPCRAVNVLRTVLHRVLEGLSTLALVLPVLAVGVERPDRTEVLRKVRVDQVRREEGVEPRPDGIWYLLRLEEGKVKPFDVLTDNFDRRVEMELPDHFGNSSGPDETISLVRPCAEPDAENLISITSESGCFEVLTNEPCLSCISDNSVKIALAHSVRPI